LEGVSNIPPPILEVTMYFIDKTNRGYTRLNNRVSDYQELMKEAKTNPDPGARALAIDAMNEIRKESKEVKDMRESLIKAHRSNDREEIKDIHEIVSKKAKYRNV
jgi:hypothetical protein